MCWRSVLPLLLLASGAVAGEGYIVGAGIEGDSNGGLALAALGEFGVTEETWVSATLAHYTVDSAAGADADTLSADVGVDHWFDPLGVRLGIARWGDNDSLDSDDWRASLYWRADRFSIAADYEHRDFTFDLPAADLFPRRTIDFDADGVGATLRFEVSDTVDIGFSGMDYDYGVNLRLDRNRALTDLLSFSRLSLITTLVDYRVGATLGVDAGERRWQFGLSSWEGEADRSSTRSLTVSFLNPLAEKADIEFVLGLDESELYGNVSFFSVFVYFYGAS
jgi:hypothetical protein